MEAGIDCPTAMLVDLSENSNVTTPRRTPHRKCKTPRSSKEDCGKINTVIKEKRTTEKHNILASLENIVSPSSINCNSKAIQQEPKETQKTNDTNTSLESNDCALLDQEKFDFDLSLSLETGSHGAGNGPEKQSDDEDDEVFIGAVTFKEKCIAKLIETESGVTAKVSPLTTTEMMLVQQEANTVASIIKAKGTPLKGSRPSVYSKNDPNSSDLSNLHGLKRKLDLGSDLPSHKTTELISDENICSTSVVSARKQKISTPKPFCSDNRKIGESKLKPLQRAASMRLPRSRVPGFIAKNSDPTKVTSGIQSLCVQTHHSSADKSMTSHYQETACDQGTVSSTCSAMPGQKRYTQLQRKGSIRGLTPPSSFSGGEKEETSFSGHPINISSLKKTSKLKAPMTQPDVIKSGRLKTLHANSGKTPNGCLPRGPLKATEPIRSLVPINSLVSHKGGQSFTPRPMASSHLTPPRGVTGTQTHSRRSVPSSKVQDNYCQSARSGQTWTAEIPKTRTVLTPRKSRLNSVSTDENTPVSVKAKRSSFLPTLSRSSSFNSTRSIRTSASSTGSSVDSPMSSDVSMNNSRCSNNSDISRKNAVTSSATRRSLPSPTMHLSSRLKPLKIAARACKK